MDDLPESCFACKFELEDPPPFIPENEWVDIPCHVCHEADRDGNIQPEIAWWEIAPLGEYIAVASPTELCLKCHAPTDTLRHGDVQLGGAHIDYECTGCHAAHDTTTSCDVVGCHGDVIEPELGLAAIGSGGSYALAAARALLENTTLSPREIVKKSLSIAGDICIYTNQDHVIETID